jgi:hypothetical protein
MTPFDPTNKEIRPVMTKDGRGILIAKTTDIEGNNPKWEVKYGKHYRLYFENEISEVEIEGEE